MSRARLTVVEQVYYQPSETEPTVSIESRFSRALLTEDEDAYIKRIKVSEEWMPINYQWVDKPGMIVIRNEAGIFAVNPTDEERRAELAKILEVRFSGDQGTWLVFPQESLRGLPTKPLEIRCRSEKGKATLAVIPD